MLKKFCKILSLILWTHCSISCGNRNPWLLRQSCQRCLRILFKSSHIINNFLRHWRFSMRFPFVETASSNESVDYMSNVSLQGCFFNLKIRVFGQILLTSGYRIHTPMSHCDNKTVFASYHKNKIFVREHQALKSLGVRVDVNSKQQNDCFIVLSLENENYSNSHLKNVRTIKTMILNDRL